MAKLACISQPTLNLITEILPKFMDYDSLLYVIPGY